MSMRHYVSPLVKLNIAGSAMSKKEKQVKHELEHDHEHERENEHELEHEHEYEHEHVCEHEHGSAPCSYYVYMLPSQW